MLPLCGNHRQGKQETCMKFFRLIIAVLAVWRLTHLLQQEDGPFAIFERGRSMLRRISLAGLADCFYCLSLWSSLPFALWLGSGWKERGTLWLALSGGAILIHRISETPDRPALYYEEPYRKEEPLCPAAVNPEDNHRKVIHPIREQFQ
jgi:hypothetical protein